MLDETDASILVYNFRPERTSFNMYAEFTQPQLSFLALVPCVFVGLPVHNLLNIHVPS